MGNRRLIDESKVIPRGTTTGFKETGTNATNIGESLREVGDFMFTDVFVLFKKNYNCHAKTILIFKEKKCENNYGYPLFIVYGNINQQYGS